MVFKCPVCDHDVGAGDKICPNCKEPLHVGSFFKGMFKGGRGAFARATEIECPACHKASTAKSNKCQHCGCDFSVSAALIPLLKPLRKKWDALTEDQSPAARRKRRILYVVLSAAVFWLVLGFSAKQGSGWYLFAALSIVYLAVFTLLLVVLVPRDYLALFFRRRKLIEKLGLVFNYFTALLLLQDFIATWTARAEMLAFLFFASWLGFYIFLYYVYPVWWSLSTYFTETVTPISPADAQGRTAFRD